MSRWQHWDHLGMPPPPPGLRRRNSWGLRARQSPAFWGTSPSHPVTAALAPAPASTCCRQVWDVPAQLRSRAEGKSKRNGTEELGAQSEALEGGGAMLAQILQEQRRRSSRGGSVGSLSSTESTVSRPCVMLSLPLRRSSLFSVSLWVTLQPHLKKKKKKNSLDALETLSQNFKYFFFLFKI